MLEFMSPGLGKNLSHILIKTTGRQVDSSVGKGFGHASFEESHGNAIGGDMGQGLEEIAVFSGQGIEAFHGFIR